MNVKPFLVFKETYLNVNSEIISAKNVLVALDIIEANQERVEQLYLQAENNLIDLLDESLEKRRLFAQQEKNFFVEELEKATPVYNKFGTVCEDFGETMMFHRFKTYFSDIIVLLQKLCERRIDKLSYLELNPKKGLSGVKSKTIDILPEYIEAVFKSFNIHVEQHYHSVLLSAIKGKPITGKIIFNGTTSTLAYAINQLYINGIISNNGEQTKEWIANTFQYTSGRDGKVYDISKNNLTKYITKNPSNSKPHIQISGIKELIADYLDK